MNGDEEDQSPNTTVKRAAFVGAPGPKPTQEQLADIPSGQLPPPALGVGPGLAGPDPTRVGVLTDARDRYVKELTSNPDLMRRVTNSAYWEVANQGPKAWQAYLETLTNRGAARKQGLNAIISSARAQGGYFPDSTIKHLDDPLNQDTQAFQSKLIPILNSVLAGSNMSNYATGNQSEKVTSGGAQITVPREKDWGDDFVREIPDADWIAAVSKQQAQPPESGSPTPIGAQSGAPPPRAERVDQPVQSFAKGGMVLPVSAEEPDEDSYISLRKHHGGWGSLGAVNA